LRRSEGAERVARASVQGESVWPSAPSSAIEELDRVEVGSAGERLDESDVSRDVSPRGFEAPWGWRLGRRGLLPRGAATISSSC